MTSRSVRVLREWWTALAVVVLLLGLAGCVARPEAALDAAEPQTAPVRNIGNFEEALRCMDDLFLAQGKRDIYITTAGIPDATGLIAAGTKEMFISAVSQMSEKSGAFHFVDYDPTQLDVQVLSEMVGLRPDFVAPNYYVRGAITQLDSGVLSSAHDASLSTPFANLGISHDRIVSIMSVDMNVAQLTTRQILPGISANNSIAVVQTNKGANLGGVIGEAGVSLGVSLDRSEGFHQAVRDLIDLSTVEVLGKLTQVPYWECLSIEPTNPSFRAQARAWFDTMTGSERDNFARTSLIRTGYLRDGGDSGGDLSSAIARYQADNDLIPNGRMDFDFYYRILAVGSRQRGVGPTAPDTRAVAAVSASVSPVASPPPADPPRTFLTTPHGPQPSYRIGDSMTLQLQPSRDGFVYCYYQDANGDTSRIFPNRFQPDPFIHGGTRIEVPPSGNGAFDIRFDKGGTEAIACLASNDEIGLRLPTSLKVRDLQPMPVHGIDDIVAQFRKLGGAKVEDARMVIEVSR